MSEFIIDAIFAAIAGLGFSFANNPPKRILIWCAILGGIGYSLRLVLINSQICNYVLATLISSITVGFFALLLGRRIKVPIEVISFPALLPMIPGLQAYKSVLSVFQFINSDNQMDQLYYLSMFFDNIFVTIAAIFALAIGISIILFIFYEESFTMTRRQNFKNKYFRKLKL